MIISEQIENAIANMTASFGDKFNTDEMYDSLYLDITLNYFLAHSYFDRSNTPALLEQLIWLTARAKLMAEYLNGENNPPQPTPDGE